MKCLCLVPNVVFYQILVDRYLERLEYVKTSLDLNHLFIRFEVEGELNEEPLLGVSESATIAETMEIEPGGDSESSQQGFSRSLSKKSLLNPKYTFETYVRGDSNQFAHATCSAVADNPGLTYNPLLYTEARDWVKPHLLHAVGARVMQRNPDAKVTYISSERFMNEMIYCLRFNKMWDFRRKYRNCDLFLVDDIQFISGKERTQENFSTHLTPSTKVKNK